ncbi:MAG: class I SAM-dependent methyltransferase [Marinosulfonomonas sp.]|nr:class I SAM-dependent methyltransferase [Marinosulfonomonas sp.]
MDNVAAQYEAYPYPERDPADEAKRLITGSPSHPLEIDHHVFGGKRDWRKPLRVLVAGGGTGDALIQLAQVLTTANRAYEITYVDLSRASRKIAEERAGVRGLTNITFKTGSLLDAPDMGSFDYIDCCGVLHHLPEPQAGFDALAQALAPGGGLGFMVYAPYGRSGVYPLQEAFGVLFEGLTPKERLERAKAVFAKLPKSHPFLRNQHVLDHQQGDAGFYDLLLHSQDRPFDVATLLETLTRAGLRLSSFTQPAMYDPADFLGEAVTPPDDPVHSMALAEKLRGTIKNHVGYAVLKDAKTAAVAGTDPALIPHLKAGAPQAVAREVASKGRLRLTVGAEKPVLELPKAAAPLIALIDGRRSLGEIARGGRMDGFAFNAAWGPVHRALTGQGLLLYSRLLA